jgi:hypothetical protein
MIPAAEVQEPVVNEELWRAWVKRGRLHEQAAGRKLKLGLGIVLVALAVGFYFLNGR